MSEKKCEKYREAGLVLLQDYIDSQQTVIGEFSGDFKVSAEILKKRVMMYLKAFDYDEEKFSELIEDSWLFEVVDE